MKSHVIAIIYSTLLVCSLQARVGETEQEIKSRFGDGAPSDIQRQAGARTLKFKKGNFQIEVVLHNGQSIMEVYKRLDVGGAMPEQDVENILDGYQSPKRNWRYDRRDKRWESSTPPKLIAYLYPGHEDFLFIKNLEACDALDKAHNGSKGL